MEYNIVTFLPVQVVRYAIPVPDAEHSQGHSKVNWQLFNDCSSFSQEIQKLSTFCGYFDYHMMTINNCSILAFLVTLFFSIHLSYKSKFQRFTDGQAHPYALGCPISAKFFILMLGL